jgi:hypothetical protein
MMQQMTNGDRLAEVVQLRQILADVVVERQSVFLREELDGERGELLGHGGDVEDRRGRDRDAVLA